MCFSKVGFLAFIAMVINRILQMERKSQSLKIVAVVKDLMAEWLQVLKEGVPSSQTSDQEKEWLVQSSGIRGVLWIYSCRVKAGVIFIFPLPFSLIFFCFVTIWNAHSKLRNAAICCILCIVYSLPEIHTKKEMKRGFKLQGVFCGLLSWP